jgi:hypothetical protein
MRPALFRGSNEDNLAKEASSFHGGICYCAMNVMHTF